MTSYPTRGCLTTHPPLPGPGPQDALCRLPQASLPPHWLLRTRGRSASRKHAVPVAGLAPRTAWQDRDGRRGSARHGSGDLVWENGRTGREGGQAPGRTAPAGPALQRAGERPAGQPGGGPAGSPPGLLPGAGRDPCPICMVWALGRRSHRAVHGLTVPRCQAPAERGAAGLSQPEARWGNRGQAPAPRVPPSPGAVQADPGPCQHVGVPQPTGRSEWGARLRGRGGGSSWAGSPHHGGCRVSAG